MNMKAIGDESAPADVSSPPEPISTDLELALRLHRELNAPGRRHRRLHHDASNKNPTDSLEPISARPSSRTKDLTPKTSSKLLFKSHHVAVDLSVRKSVRVTKPFHARYVKIFVQGIPWGHVASRSSLTSRGDLAKEACRRFGRDGFSCSEADLDVIAITAAGNVIRLPKHGGEEEGSMRWQDGMRDATRVYLSIENERQSP